MGLDWNPMNRPKPGMESEYEELFHTLAGDIPDTRTLWEKIKGKKAMSREVLTERFLNISIPAYETLKAPQVGIDEKATEWAKQQFDNRVDKTLSLEDFISQMHGYYVVELVPEHDGIPMYIAPHYESHVFRAKFLEDVQDLIGPDNMDLAYTSQLADGAVSFGHTLMKLADDFANANDVGYLKDQRRPPDTNEDSVESKAHIMFSAAKWLLWWGERGHGYEADF